MEREVRLTEDGSHTIYVRELDESYHSIHGALQESTHVFINQGLKRVGKSPIHILELGLGTGLNLLLTLNEVRKLGIEIHYHAVEKYPLSPEEYSKLNYEKVIIGLPPRVIIKMHEALWDQHIKLTDSFSFYKEQGDFRSMNPPGMYDLVYFDAFAPDKQPYLWSLDIFKKLSRQVNPGGILVSYTSKGSVRRALETSGFEVDRVSGPPGKREMIRATRR